MEKFRFLLYMAVIGSFLLLFTAIKSLSPEKEYEPSIDYIGRRLYRPIFFGTNEIKPKKEVKKQEESSPIETQKNDEVFKDEVAEKVEIRDDTTNKIQKNSEKVEETPKKTEVKNAPTTATKKDESYFTQLIEDYQTNVLSEKKYRNDVVVRYYRHASDGARAELLVEFGFYLHERPVSKTRFETVDSNVIYYGHEFPEKDLKLITYLLVKNGIPIKRIQPFKDYDGWKRKSLEIGGNPKLKNKPTLTYKQIQEYQVAK